MEEKVWIYLPVCGLRLSRDCHAKVPILRSKNNEAFPGGRGSLQASDVTSQVTSAWVFRCQASGWSWRLIWGEREPRKVEARDLDEMSLEYICTVGRDSQGCRSVPTCAGERMRELKKKLVLKAMQHWGESEAEMNAFKVKPGNGRKLGPCSDMAGFTLDRRQKVSCAFDWNAFSQSVCITLLPLPGKLTACQ